MYSLLSLMVCFFLVVLLFSVSTLLTSQKNLTRGQFNDLNELNTILATPHFYCPPIQGNKKTTEYIYLWSCRKYHKCKVITDEDPSLAQCSPLTGTLILINRPFSSDHQNHTQVRQPSSMPGNF